MAKKKTPELIVFFDTNVLYTQVASDLVRNDVKRIISDNSSHPDLKIYWCIPQVVIGERKYQMMTKAKELLPSLVKLEKLIGHGLGIGEDTLGLHVDKAIDDNINQLSLIIEELDTTSVDWNDLINRSVTRAAPFEQSEKEKGFRDSIIAQTFAQKHSSSPSTPNICRLALVTADQRLIEYTKELVGDAKNVRLLNNLDELESLINTLVSTIPEEFAEELAKKASKVFFEKENQKSFYYKEEIGEKIREQFATELTDPILPDHNRNNGTWWISEPIFIKKEKQRIHWISPVEPEFEIFHYEDNEDSQDSSYTEPDIAKTYGLPGFHGITDSSYSKYLNKYALGGSLLNKTKSRKKVTDLKGREKFVIHWSANLSQAQNLTALKLEKIQHIGNDLPENNS